MIPEPTAEKDPSMETVLREARNRALETFFVTAMPAGLVYTAAVIFLYGKGPKQDAVLLGLWVAMLVFVLVAQANAARRSLRPLGARAVVGSLRLWSQAWLFLATSYAGWAILRILKGNGFAWRDVLVVLGIGLVVGIPLLLGGLLASRDVAKRGLTFS